MHALGQNLLEFLRGEPVFTLFVVLALGYLIGRIRIGSFAFGPVAGVLFAGMVFGRLGFSMAPGAQALGFALFIFSVGYQAGPKFFEVIRSNGLRYFVLALVVTGTGLLLAWAWSKGLSLPPGGSAGLLAGGMTSSPTLAAAQEAVRTGHVLPPEGWTVDGVMGNIAATYAITYIFGLAGLIAVIKLLPGLQHIDPQEQARSIERESSRGTPATDLRTRGYRIENGDICRVPTGKLRKQYWDGVSASRLKRDGRYLRPADEDYLEPGDELFARGDLTQFLGGLGRIGQEIPVPADVELESESAQVVVVRKTARGLRLEELALARRHGLVVTAFERDRMRLPVSPGLRLERGDVLTVSGPAEGIAALVEEIGPVETDLVRTDMLVFAGGIALGVLIGLVSVTIGGVSIGLGSAGGLLTSGIFVGLLNATRPTVGRFPGAARWIFMEFGLLLFMTGVVLRAGRDIVERFLAAGPSLILAGSTVTLIPALRGCTFGRKVLGIEPVLLLGALTGSMTSGASLQVVTSAARSSVPALGYTGRYAFANVLLTAAGTLIMVL